MISKPHRFSVIIVATFALAAVSQADVVTEFEGTNLSHQFLPYKTPPYTFEGSRYLVATVVTSSEVLRALVPKPLEPNTKGLLHVIIVRQNVVDPEPFVYNEAILSVPVSFGDVEGSYFPVLYLDRALPILPGREIWGFNKVDAEIEWTEGEGVVHARVIRGGDVLIDLKAHLGEKLSEIPEQPNNPIFNLKIIPSAKLGSLPDIKQLTTTSVSKTKITTLRPAMGQLTLGSGPYDPLASIPVLRLVMTSYSEQNFVLGGGEIVHDYLDRESVPVGNR